MQKFLNRVIKFNIYLLTFLTPLFWLPFSFEAFEFNKQYLLFFFSSLTFLIWIVKMVSVEKELKIRFSLMDVPVLAFFATAVISAVFSIDRTFSFLGFYGRFSDGLLGLLSLVMFYFLLTNNITTKKKAAGDKTSGPEITISGLIKVFLCAAFIAVFLASFSIFGVWGRINELVGGKLPAVMQTRVFNPVSGSLESFSVWLAAVVAFLVGSLLNGSGKRLRKIGYWGLFLLSLTFLAIIDFRTVWIMMLLTMVPLLVFSLWKRIFSDDVNRLLIPVFLIIFSITFIFLGTANLKAKIFASQLPQELVSGQMQSWLVGLKGATENIKSVFFGSGIGNWHYDFAKFKPASFNQTLLWNLRLDRPSSHLPEILATTGFLGLLSYLGLILFIFFRYYLLLSKISPRPIAVQKESDKENVKAARPAAAGFDVKPQIPFLVIILALIAAQFLFYQTTALAFTFWLFLGLWVAGGQKQIKEKIISFKNFPELSLVFSVFLIIVGLAMFLVYFMAVKFYIADINYKEGLITVNLQKLESASQMNPYQSQYKIILARAYLGQALSEVAKPEAERDLNAVSLDVYKALTFAKSGQIGNVVVSGATEIAPNRVVSWETLGMIYRDTQGLVAGVNEWAIKAFEQAIKLEPTNPFLHTELGRLYLTAGDVEKAKAEFNKAKSLKSDYPEPVLRLSLIYEQEKNLDEALRQVEGLNNLYPYDVEILFQLGRLYFNAKRTDAAITQFAKAVQLSPTHSNAIYALGVAYQQKGQADLAIQAFERVLELNPDNEDVKARLGELRGTAEKE